jgi:hypothetical protein
MHLAGWRDTLKDKHTLAFAVFPTAAAAADTWWPPPGAAAAAAAAWGAAANAGAATAAAAAGDPACRNQAAASVAGKLLIRWPSGVVRGGKLIPAARPAPPTTPTAPPPTTAPAGGGRAAAAAAAPLLLACRPEAPAAAAAPDSSTVAISWPGITVSSTLTRMPSRVPSIGALMSMVTCWVSHDDGCCICNATTGGDDAGWMCGARGGAPTKGQLQLREERAALRPPRPAPCRFRSEQ